MTSCHRVPATSSPLQAKENREVRKHTLIHLTHWCFLIQGEKMSLLTLAAWTEMTFQEARSRALKRTLGDLRVDRHQVCVWRIHTEWQQFKNYFSGSKTWKWQKFQRQTYCLMTEGPLYTFWVKANLRDLRFAEIPGIFHLFSKEVSFKYSIQKFTIALFSGIYNI